MIAHAQPLKSNATNGNGSGRLERKIAFGFIGSLFILCLICIASLMSTRQLIRDGRINEHTRTVLQHIAEVNSSLLNVESATRSFIITGDSSYLGDLPQFCSRVMSDLDQLRSLTADNPTQQDFLRNLEPLLKDRIAIARTLIEEMKSAGFTAASASIRTGNVRSIATKINAILANMGDEENRLLKIRTHNAETSIRVTVATVWAGCIAAFVLVAVAGVLIRRDLVARRRLDAVLRENESRFRFLADSMSQIVWTADADGLVDYVNARWSLFTGRSRETAAGSGWKAALHPDDIEYFIQHWSEARECGKSFEGEYRLLNQHTDAARWHLCRCEPRCDDEGRVLQWILTWTDIESHKQTENQLQNAKDAALTASDAKSQFLARMSHEIRTPLNGVIGMLDLLLGVNLDPQQQRYALLAKSSAESLTTLINDILDFSKIEAGKLEISEIDFDLHVTVEEAVEIMAPRAARKNLELASFVAPVAPRRVNGDPDRLRQILVNLIGNAVKFTESGTIKVEVESASEVNSGWSVRFAVTDSGIGISPDGMNRLFKAFSQVDVSTTRTYGGTWLGLAICKQLTELMGGTIGVDRLPTRGSRFWFEVTFGTAAPVKDIKPPSIDPRRLRVLGVDDEPTTREVMRQQLESLQFETSVAASGREALPMLEQAKEENRAFSIALIDRDMPEMNGIELAREIKARAAIRETVLMILVSTEEVPDPAAIAAQGFHGHMTKPLRQSQLFDAIMTTLKRAVKSDDTAVESKKSQPMVSLDSTDIAGRHANTRVLVAEDNEVNLMVATEILTRAGYQFAVANNGEEAANAALEGGFDIVLMDCQMPVMDGFDATRRIREAEAMAGNNNRLPIIALTANAIRGDRERCMAAGMDEYVSKPLNPQKLIESIDKTLDAHRIKTSRGLFQEMTGPIQSATMPHHAAVPPFDWHALHHEWPDNDPFVTKLVTKFVTQTRGDLKRIEKGIDIADAKEVERLAHSLKSAAGFVQARAVSAAAEKIESLAHDRNLADSGTALLELREEFDRCVREYADGVK